MGDARGGPGEQHRTLLEALLGAVGEGQRFSDLERWRKGPADPTGKNLRLSLRRAAEIHGLGIDGGSVRALVPARRLVDLARYGMAAKAPRLRRHPPARRLATLLATVAHLQAASIDDCLELFELLMVTELLGKAKRETDKQRARGTSTPSANGTTVVHAVACSQAQRFVATAHNPDISPLLLFESARRSATITMATT